MGWGAAVAYGQETGVTAEDAYDILYGGDEQRQSNTAARKCPLCGKKCRDPAGVLRHLQGPFHKPSARLSEAIAALSSTPSPHAETTGKDT